MILSFTQRPLPPTLPLNSTDADRLAFMREVLIFVI
jgi:hypothetical protein